MPDTSKSQKEIESEAEEVLADDANIADGSDAVAGADGVDEENLDAKAAEYLEGWQRARAELANYRKRVERDREQWRTQLAGDVIMALLPVLDDFDLAMENLPEGGEAKDWLDGLHLIHRKFQNQLAELGVQEIEAEGQAFDPSLHEAALQEPSEEHESGMIIGVIRKGYQLNGQVLRPALVRVAS